MVKAEFQVIRDGQKIYGKEFVVRHPFEFAECSKLALEEFMAQWPSLPLTDEGMILRWDTPHSD